MDAIYLFLDPILIFPFRLTNCAFCGFLIGCFVLCFWSTLLGVFTHDVIYRFNSNYYQSIESEMINMHNMSVLAAGQKDKESFKSCNHEANEFFGKTFFAGAALFASSLWPLPFALGWLDTRFAGVEFDLAASGFKVGVSFLFIPVYILCRILFSRLRRYLPFFKTTIKLKEESQGKTEVISWSDLSSPSTIQEKTAK